MIAAPSAPPGSPPALGAISVQNRAWFQCPPPLLRTAVRTPSGTSAMRRHSSSSDHEPSSGAFSIAAFRLVTYALWCLV